MSLIEDAIQNMLDRMTPDERHQLILNVVERMLSHMSSGERVGVMEHVVDRFMDGLDPQARQDTARELVPRLLSQLMKSGNMSVDDLLSAAIGSLGAMDASPSRQSEPLPTARTGTPPASSQIGSARDAVSE